MAPRPQNPDTIDEYIARATPGVRPILARIRRTIRAAAPGATEVISYQIPAFKAHGVLVYFAAFKHHIGFFPPVQGDPELEAAVAPYAGPKGNLRFPLDQPIPHPLITRIVKHRLRQDAARVTSRTTRPKPHR